MKAIPVRPLPVTMATDRAATRTIYLIDSLAVEKSREFSKIFIAV
jgi:hypothetical protein